MSGYPVWLATENAVAAFFTLLGFDVEHVSILGRQIDVVAHRVDNFTGERQRHIIEVTLEKVDVQKGALDSQKLLLAQKKFPESKLMLVSMAGFTDDQAATLKELGVAPRQFHELESTLLPLRQYALSLKRDLEKSVAPDIGYQPAYYIEPELTLRLADGDKILKGDEWIRATLGASLPGICAILGSLGSGKTSLLKRFLEVGIEQFLESPNDKPLTLFVPLGRYKQHAGDLDQMLMSELTRAGVRNYPASYVRFLLENRRIILLLDGLDEVHPIQNTDDILETVTNITEGVGRDACAIISCRKQFFESSSEELAYFGTYTAGKLKDINSNLQKLLRGQTSTSIAEISPFDMPRIRKYLNIRCRLSENEVEILLARYYGFHEMATTPVLLAMIATTVSEGSLKAGEALPYPLIELYEAYTTRWIERDVGRARLSAAQRLRFSERLADKMLWESKDSATWSDLSQALRGDPEWGNNPLTHEEAELDIRNSGFLIREMDDRWRFIHRSIMEYFSARTEMGNLQRGDRPRFIPSDGYRLFLSELLARHWATHGKSPIPQQSWQSGRGDEVRANQFSILAAASKLLPEGEAVPLQSVGSIQVKNGTEWRSVHFEGMILNIIGGDMSFDKCSFSRCKIQIPSREDASVYLNECTFSATELRVDEFPNWKTPFDAHTREAVDVFEATLQFCQIVDNGCRVFVGSKEWLLGLRHLGVFLECARRLKGKAFVHNFLKGSYANELKALVSPLLQAELLEEDRSRQNHQLSWTAQGRDLATRIKTNPVSAQEEIYHLFAKIE